jgi:hypothetical protein
VYTYVGEAVAVVVVDVVPPVVAPVEPAPVVVAVPAARLADAVLVVPGTIALSSIIVSIIPAPNALPSSWNT